MTYDVRSAVTGGGISSPVDCHGAGITVSDTGGSSYSLIDRDTGEPPTGVNGSGREFYFDEASLQRHVKL